MERRLVDKIRESGGHADIGTAEDGAIVGMKNYDGRLIILKEKAIYEMVFADSIDPDRTNENLAPTIHKLIIDKGADSLIVCKTFISAKTLFNNDHIIEEVNCNKIVYLSINLLEEVNQLEREILNYKADQYRVSENYNQNRKKKQALEVPSITGLDSKCKTIFQKTDHVEQILMEIITKFYDNNKLTKQSHFPKFLEIISKKYGEEDQFVLFISSSLKFMETVRELRNGFDHRLNTVKATNFDIQKNGNIISPTIELTHKNVKLERTDLLQFLEYTLKNFLFIMENTFAFIAEKHKRTDKLPIFVKEIPMEKRINEHVKYCFWSNIGEDGYFMQ